MVTPEIYIYIASVYIKKNLETLVKGTFQAKQGFHRSLVASDLRSETKGSWFESGCYLRAEVSSLQ